MPVRPTAKPIRPLSPHLQVYRPQLTTMLSILHRATGVGLSVGLVILVAWLMMAAASKDLFGQFIGLFQNPVGQVVLFGFSWAFFYHFCTGIRHLLWDSGWFLSIRGVYVTGWIAVALSLLVTGFVWYDIEAGDWKALGILAGEFIGAVIALGIVGMIALFVLGMFSGTVKRPTSMRSDLGKVRGLGAAKEGTAHWWALRMTSAALVLLSLCVVVDFFVYKVYGDFDTANSWLQSPYVCVFLILFIGVGFHHAANGIQVVVEDYVHNEKLKVITVTLVKFVAVALALLAAMAIFKILFFGVFIGMLQNAQQHPQ